MGYIGFKVYDMFMSYCNSFLSNHVMVVQKKRHINEMFLLNNWNIPVCFN